MGLDGVAVRIQLSVSGIVSADDGVNLACAHACKGVN